MKEFKETLEQIENFPKQGLFSRNRKMDIFQNVEKRNFGKTFDAVFCSQFFCTGFTLLHTILK